MRPGLPGLLLVAAALPALFVFPGDIGAVRVAGVSLAWWYGGIVAPLLAVALAVARGPSPPDDPGASR